MNEVRCYASGLFLVGQNEVREALREGNVRKASHYGRVFTLTPVV